MAIYKGRVSAITPTRKSSSQGRGGRGRCVKISPDGVTPEGK